MKDKLTLDKGEFNPPSDNRKTKSLIQYEVTFKNLFSGDKRTIKLGDSRTSANEEFKKVRKSLSWWWRSGVINC